MTDSVHVVTSASRVCRGVNLVQLLDWPVPFLDDFAPPQLGTALFLRCVIDSNGVLRAPDCAGISEGCDFCACKNLYEKIKSKLQVLRERAKQNLLASTVPYSWRSANQLRLALAAKDEVKEVLDLQVLALRRRELQGVLQASAKGPKVPVYLKHLRLVQ